VRKLLLLAASGVAAGLLASACNPVTPYAAVVNGHVISQSSLDAQLEAIADNSSDVSSIESASRSQGGSAVQIRGPQPGTYSTTFASEALDQDIEFVLIHQAFQARHLHVSTYETESARADLPSELAGSGTPVDLNQFPRWYQNTLVERQAEIMALEADLGHTSLSSAAVAAYYSTHRSEMYDACVSRILVTTPAAASSVLKDLASGTSFSAEAAAKSQDQNTAQTGGQLGCGTGPQFTQAFGAAFAQAVGTAAANTPTGPLIDQGGFDIIEVTQRQALTASQAAAQIRASLVSAGTQPLDTLLTAELNRAQVSVDPRYGSWSGAGSGSASRTGVIPPASPKVRSDEPPPVAASLGTATP
jgi:hypothetical protein